MNNPCWAKSNHCKLTGHQTNHSQEDKTPSTWNNSPFCKKGTRKTCNKNTLPISSIVDDPIPPISTLLIIPTRFNNGPRMPTQPNNRNPGFSQSKPTLPIAPFQNNPAPLMAPFQPKPKPNLRITSLRPLGTQPFTQNMRF